MPTISFACGKVFSQSWNNVRTASTGGSRTRWFSFPGLRKHGRGSGGCGSSTTRGARSHRGDLESNGFGARCNDAERGLLFGGYDMAKGRFRSRMAHRRLCRWTDAWLAFLGHCHGGGFRRNPGKNLNRETVQYYGLNCFFNLRGWAGDCFMQVQDGLFLDERGHTDRRVRGRLCVCANALCQRHRFLRYGAWSACAAPGGRYFGVGRFWR